jgi:hypothetical protein
MANPPTDAVTSSEQNVNADAYGDMIRMIFGASIVQVIRCAALFSLADHAERGRITARNFSVAEGLDPDAAERFLRACTAFGLLSMSDDAGYAGTALLRTLRSDTPHSLRDLALIQGGPGHWAPWGRLDDALRTGCTQTEATLGQSLWDYYASDAGRAEGRAVAGAMGGSTRDIDAAAEAAVDTTQVKTVVDVGGASGSLVQALMQGNPALCGIVLDLPSVIAQVSHQAVATEIASRLTFVPGSFFGAVPAADLYVLRHILHDWSDAECAVILRNCRASARPGARLMLIELTMASQPSGFACQIDLTMLIAAGGRERQPAEYERLLSQAGFRLLATRPLTPTHSLFEAVAI